jgi:hypothetical protein
MYRLPSLLLIAGIASGIMIASCTSKPNNKEFPVLVGLHEGDIVFRRGNSLASRLVLTAERDGGFSHVGLVVRFGNTMMIVHAVPGENAPGQPDMIKMEDVSSFFDAEKAETGAVMRTSLNSTALHKVASKAIEVYKNKTRFDHRYNLNDTTELYCSEFVWFVFKSVNFDITDGRRSSVDIPPFKGNYIFPSDIQKNKKLTMIYHF